MPLDIVEAWTGPIDMQLKVDGASLSLSTGDTVELVLRRSDREIVSTTGEVTILTATCGVVRYSPSALDFLARWSPYAARFKVTDGTGKVVFFPNAKPDPWTVHSP
jgi:hypothetical protein